MRVRKLTDTPVRGVLVCLAVAPGSLSVSEVAVEYNKRYPPWRIGKIVLPMKSEQEVKEILEFLITTAYASRELFSFTNVALEKSIFRYRLTHEGMQYLASLKR
jgi:hypothetical protein